MNTHRFVTLSTLIALMAASAALADVTGTVYNDLNKNGIRDAGEPGIAGVYVSNSKEVAKTDAQGRYTLPVYDDMVVFVVKPTGYMTPVDATTHVAEILLHPQARRLARRDQAVRRDQADRSAAGRGRFPAVQGRGAPELQSDHQRRHAALQ